MPNPNRPQYQDTIEETWGQAVADTVVRRYTSTADRDADLAGFTPAQLAGQVVTVQPAGAQPVAEIHDGTAWAPMPRVQGGEPVMATDGGGLLFVSVPAGGKVISAVATGAQVNFPVIMIRNNQIGAGGTQICFQLWNATGSGTIVNTTIQFAYVIVWSN
jgi:hypothetical protein